MVVFPITIKKIFLVQSSANQSLQVWVRTSSNYLFFLCYTGVGVSFSVTRSHVTHSSLSHTHSTPPSPLGAIRVTTSSEAEKDVPQRHGFSDEGRPARRTHPPLEGMRATAGDAPCLSDVILLLCQFTRRGSPAAEGAGEDDTRPSPPARRHGVPYLNPRRRALRVHGVVTSADRLVKTAVRWPDLSGLEPVRQPGSTHPHACRTTW